MQSAAPYGRPAARRRWRNPSPRARNRRRRGRSSPHCRRDLRLVDTTGARGDDEHRAVALRAAEDERLGDFSDSAADRRRGVGGGARARVKFEHLEPLAERSLDFSAAGLAAGVTGGTHSGLSSTPLPKRVDDPQPSVDRHSIMQCPPTTACRTCEKGRSSDERVVDRELYTPPSEAPDHASRW